MKTWLDIEEIFQSAQIEYQQRDWLFLCQINGAEFYYSPQKQKWRLKETRVWQFTDSAQSFVAEAKEYLQAKKEAESKKSQEKTRAQTKTSSKRNSRQTKQQKKTKKTTNKASSTKNNRQTRWDKKQTTDVVRTEFLELFAEKFKLGIERGYKPAWIWNSLINDYLLTPSEVCWLCTVFDYKPGWAYHQLKYQDPSITYQDVLAMIVNNRNDWLNYFNRRWSFSAYERAKQNYEEKWREDWNRQKHYHSTTQTERAPGYQVYLDILQITYPVSQTRTKISL